MSSTLAAPGAGLFDGLCAGLLQASREAIVMIDASQAIVALNPAAEQLLRCSGAEVLGTSLERFVPAPWRAQHAAQVQSFAASGARQSAMAHSRRIEVLRADGTTLPAEVTLSRIDMDEGGRPRTLFAALLRDTSDECALEEQLARLERRMRAVFELSPTAIWICEDDRLVYANRAAARLFGVDSIEHLIGREVWTLLDAPSHELLRQEIERTLVGQTVGALVAGRLLRADGQARQVEIALAALPDHGLRTVQMVVNDVTARRLEAAELERSRRALRELSASVVEAREEERRRIARELHDELGQRLTALKIELAALGLRLGQAGDDARLASMQTMLDDTLASVRRIASDLRPLMLDDLGLTAAIEWLARDASRRMGLNVHTKLPLSEPNADPRVATAMYRMVQEALTNVARHARAKTVQVELRRSGEQLLLEVSDDGMGASEEALQRAGSFGLLGLRERAYGLGGEFSISSRSGHGTVLTARLPLQPPVPRALEADA